VAEYRVLVARAARKELQAFSRPLAARIVSRIEDLATAPRPPGCRKIVGEDDLFRIRIGDYRVIYRVSDAERVVDVTAVRHRRDAYR
jgi:mRNA interferase RelE/StbE